MVILMVIDVNGNFVLCMVIVIVEIGIILFFLWIVNDIGDQGDGSSYIYDFCIGDNLDFGDFNINIGGYNFILQDSDNLVFVSVFLCGNGGIQACIENVQGGYVGFMIWESSVLGVKMIVIYFNFINLIWCEIWIEENGVWFLDLLYVLFLYWLRLRCQGDYICVFYCNIDNGDWQLFYQAYLLMDNCVEMGLVVFIIDLNGDVSVFFGMVCYCSQVNVNFLVFDNLIWEMEIFELLKVIVLFNLVQDVFILYFSRLFFVEGIVILFNEFGQYVV